jgi:uncharacterized membrane protein YoaT (DUF817 family)
MRRSRGRNIGVARQKKMLKEFGLKKNYSFIFFALIVAAMLQTSCAKEEKLQRYGGTDI